jgi:hypothetical protein
MLLVLPPNIRLGFKDSPGKNTLQLICLRALMTKKIRCVPEANVIKLFTVVIYRFSK